MATQRSILWTVTDPRGLSITLTDDVWQNITRKHPAMILYLDIVQRTAQEPEAIYFDPKSTEIRTTGAKIYHYYTSKLLSGDLADKLTVVIVKVVIEPVGNQGYVETAYPVKQVKKGLVLEWTR
jgi:hypothetical protein